MKIRIFLSLFMMSVVTSVFAQNLKVEKISALPKPTLNLETPTDLNGNKCALVEINLAEESVAFEGNVMGTPTHSDGRYYVFLTPNSKYLNIKYPGEKPLMIKFSDYKVTSLPASSTYFIEMTEPTKNVAANLDASVANVSDEAENLYMEGSLLLAQQNYTQAFGVLTKAHELGHPKATYMIGMIYSDPNYLMRKNKLAAKIVNMKVPENPVKRDMTKAAEYYKMSAEAGYVTAQFALAECYEKGDGVKKDKAEAQKWYAKAAEQGHMQAKDKIGEKVEKHRTFGIVTSYGSGENQFILNSIECDPSDLSAISNGRKDANDQYCALIKLLLPFDKVEVVGDLVGESVYKTNEYWAYVPQGTKEIQINYPDFEPLKVNFKNHGIDQVISKNTYNVSISFPIDLLSNDVDLSETELYKIAMGFMERRDNQYIRWLTKAADKGYPHAKYNLGTAYLYGTAAKKDKNKGITLLEQAADAGLGEAAYMLGQYYELQARKPKIAQQWYDKAASLDYELAKGKKATNPFKKALLPF